MRSAAVLSVLALALLAVSVSASPFIRATHRGALNSRLSAEELAQESVQDVQAQWLTQILDHQDLSNNATFQQKYYVNDTFYKFGGPVFYMLGGEGPVSPAYVTGHFIVGDYAAKYGAMVVALEHRFYGASVPNNDSSVQNLKFLSSAQALEDIVLFHAQIMSQYQLPPRTKWITFGGSYSGSLSAWARLKYPQLIHGAFSASAPVQAQLDFYQYFEVVSNSVGQSCSETIQAANNQVMTMLNDSTGAGTAKLVSLFNFCESPANENDIITLMGALSGPIAGIVQYNDDNNKYQPMDIPTMCTFLQEAVDPLTGLVNLWNAANAYTNTTACTDISYTNFIQSMQATSDGRSWTYQTCIEFGYFQDGEATDQPFPSVISLASFQQQCADIFGLPPPPPAGGASALPAINYINGFYGGWNITTSRTVFTNGDVDPWHVLGNYQSYAAQPDSASVLIHGTAHCADLYPARASDVSGLTAARVLQDQLLGQWLNTPFHAPANAGPVTREQVRRNIELQKQKKHIPQVMQA